MQEQAYIIILAWGSVRTSILHDLRKLGCSGAVMLEQSKLLSAPTWNTYGGIRTINGEPKVVRIQRYVIELHKEIEKLASQNISLPMNRGIMQAVTEEGFYWLKSFRANGKSTAQDNGIYCQ